MDKPTAPLPGSPPEAAGEPHGALFLVLGYLPLPDLLSFRGVCGSLGDAVAGDRTLWRDVVVEPPLSGRLTDDVLLDVASRAGGRLRTLALVNCWNVTDAGLRRVVDRNPAIVKLLLPGCTFLTADAVAAAAKSLRERGACLDQIWLNGVSNATKEHLDILRSVVGDGHRSPPCFYHEQHHHYRCSPSPARPDGRRPIDVDLCPRCGGARLVFDCSRQACRARGGGGGGAECRGCIFCVPRCGECGGCVGTWSLPEESACSHPLCLECWLCLPKCNACNRPYCSNHRKVPPSSSSSSSSSSSMNISAGFLCEDCQQPQEEYPSSDQD